ncbi:TVP38/TMEM64 family protein [Aliikangiella coralliicola]|uniref:TVP38/TMEM64 family membrane protein n=1 Tax=Aliikangiella coralliicola TaxID=2592383 RepID=A0A545UCY9_9GAMM|nr:VTT domain-containing protein [Aliikangiella coralliicola]TQV87330.1 VTT domain-containing protein [Aliikangiella coralliicola]
MKKPQLIKLAGILAFLVLLLFAFEVSGLRDNFNLSFLRNTIENNVFWGLLIFVVLFSVGNLIQIPGWIFLAAAVITLGKFAGGLATYVAAVSSCLVTYGIIRFLGQDALRGLESPIAQRLFQRLDRYPISSIVFLRMIFQTVPILNYALALSAVKFRHYVIGTLLGLPIPIFIYCLFFDFLALHVFALAPQ